MDIHWFGEGGWMLLSNEVNYIYNQGFVRSVKTSQISHIFKIKQGTWWIFLALFWRDVSSIEWAFQIKWKAKILCAVLWNFTDLADFKLKQEVVDLPGFLISSEGIQAILTSY